MKRRRFGKYSLNLRKEEDIERQCKRARVNYDRAVSDATRYLFEGRFEDAVYRLMDAREHACFVSTSETETARRLEVLDTVINGVSLGILRLMAGGEDKL